MVLETGRAKRELAATQTNGSQNDLPVANSVNSARATQSMNKIWVDIARVANWFYPNDNYGSVDSGWATFSEPAPKGDAPRPTRF